MFFAPSKSRRAKLQNIGVSKTSKHIQIKIKKSDPIQETQGSLKAPNNYLIYIDVLRIFTIEIREPKFGIKVYQRPVIISKTKSRS